MLNRIEALALLDLESDADNDEIRKAYRAACLRWHPDRNRNSIEEATQRFKEVQTAFKIISRNEEALADAAVDAVTRAEAFMSNIEPDGRRPLTLWRQEGKTLLRIGETLYIGEVASGQPHGSGDLIFKDGSVHHGTFASGRAEGRGVFYAANGAIFKGKFDKNRRIGTFEVVDPKGKRWSDVYNEEGKRTKRLALAAARAADAAARAADAAAALAQAKASEADAAQTEATPRKPTVPLGLTAAARAERVAAELSKAKSVTAEDAARYESLSKEERQAANEARRLAGAAIRAEARRAEGGGFAGFTPPGSPKSVRREARSVLPDESFHEASLFALADEEHEGKPSVPCRHCDAKFHPWRSAICRQHNSIWMDIPEPVDWDEFPQGGMYLCCGALSKAAVGCSIGKHEILADGDAARVPDQGSAGDGESDRRAAPAGGAAPGTPELQ